MPDSLFRTVESQILKVLRAQHAALVKLNKEAAHHCASGCCSIYPAQAEIETAKDELAALEHMVEAAKL